MKSKNYNKFITEQKEYFNEHLKNNFQQTWDDSIWYGGIHGSGWLSSRTNRIDFNFSEIRRMKGLDDIEIDEIYQEFIKAFLIVSYRNSNQSASPQKLKAEYLILKRWYSALKLINLEKNLKVHPCFLSTEILYKAFEILKENSSPINLPDHIGSMIRIQNLLNNYNFTEGDLEFDVKAKYQNRQNRTPKTRIIQKAFEGEKIDEDEIDSSKLISIRTFINIISLISLCETKGEKILLHLLLLLIVTGFRSTEAILLRTDALIKKPILDPLNSTNVEIDGIQQYLVGIQYYGAKGAGFRVHWVEPLAAKLVEMIFSNVLELTKESRSYLSYLRSKNVKDFLPEALDKIKEDFLEIDQLIDTCFGVPEKTRGNPEKRTLIIKTLAKSNVPIYKADKFKQRINRYYLKKDINNFIKSLNTYTEKNPIDHVFNYEGSLIKIPYEELLFILPYRSGNLSRGLYNKTNIMLISNPNINNFLGANKHTSAFEKYQLYENDSEYSSLTSHIPRHNINTFLALSGISEHLQAMLMGRVDIKQNQYYQHIALKHMKIKSSLRNKNEIILVNSIGIDNYLSPVEAIKKDGLIYVSEELSIDSNIKKNIQTFDNKKEVSAFIKDQFFDDYFQDIKKAFNELIDEDPNEAEELLDRHAFLSPLLFGSCMRNITLHHCPKRLACQSGDACGNFVLTGRRGELENITLKKNMLINEYNNIDNDIRNDPQYSEMLNDIRERINILTGLEAKNLSRMQKLTPIQIFNYNTPMSKLPHTLSELFAIEINKTEEV